MTGLLRTLPTRAHSAFLLALLALSVSLHARPALAIESWRCSAGNAQHTALSTVASQPLQAIQWQTPVDLQPQYSGTILYAHYGAPLATGANNIVIPVKTGVNDGFRVEVRNGRTGGLLWQYDSDYTLPVHNWLPVYSPALTPSGRLYLPGSGGTVYTTDQVDVPATPTMTRLAFYGISNYNSNPVPYDTTIQICTPLTTDAQGNVFFGYRSTGNNPLAIKSGFARIGADGSFARIDTLTATGQATFPVLNCAPAVSNDGQTLYVVVRRTTNARGDLIALDATTLAKRARVTLLDPKSGSLASLPSDGSATPMVAPDGRVFFGVLEVPGFSNAARGWLLQFDANLLPAGPPGAFGWDETPALVPTTMVPSYAGTSPYLLMSKYNFYAGVGGSGVNKLAIVDPGASQIDAFAGIAVMKEVLTIAGVTPDSSHITPSTPNAVKEWCINTCAVDPFTSSVVAGSEDGVLYRWDLTTNTFSQSIRLTPGLGEAYTPTVIGRDGRVYAINNATLFSVGTAGVLAAPGPAAASYELMLAAPRPNPVLRAASIHFSLPRPGSVTLEVLDAAGRHVATLLSGELPAGNHFARWDGRDECGSRSAQGVYFLRLSDGQRDATRRLVLIQ